MAAKHINTIIEQFKTKLKEPAGLVAQLKMAPKLREKELLLYNNNDIKSKSAVLILLYIQNNEIYIVLTKRSANLRKHSGQISFPGGKFDERDKDLSVTAFREAKEEIGFEREGVEILGWLTTLIIPVTNFEVHPLVIFSKQEPKLKISEEEVDCIIKTSIKDLLNLKNIKRTSFGNSTSGRFIKAPYFEIEGYKVWGATAMIISELLLTLFPESDYEKHNMSFY
ncbi:MAG: coenzyme A pyrophosphatase [Bacteroidetes bacterium]|nr:MAG: coenzyme A pyrophosphatase [Bacteroidota bacterium]